MSMLVASVTCLHFIMQEGDIFEHTNVECHLRTLLCQLVDCRVTHAYILNTTNVHTRAKIAVNALEGQVS